MKEYTLDQLLNRVKRSKHEVTIDMRYATENQKEWVTRMAKQRGLDVASDGKWLLIREM